MKKTIKIAIINFWPGFIFENSVAFKCLSLKFNIVIDDDNPDFIFCSVFGDYKKPLKYSCPRILFVGEPQTPDFSLYDYAIGFDFIRIDDKYGKNRYFRFPIAFSAWNNELAKDIEKPISTNDAKSFLKEKTSFCNFIYGYETHNKEREKLLDLVNRYKKVDCCGKYMNNMPDGFKVAYSMNKVEFQKRYKFTIAGENMCFPGLVTEKIIHAFYAHTIPIYIGDPLIERTFNKEAFLDANDYSEEELIDKIKEIDNNDNLFLEIIKKQKYSTNHYYSKLMKSYESFLFDIFSQSPKEAIRRQNAYFALIYEKQLLSSTNNNIKVSKMQRIKRKIIRLFRFK